MNRFITLAITAALCVGVTACGEKKPKEPLKPTTTGKVVKDPVEIAWAACVACHGATGKGDGPGAAALDPKPRDFSDAAWQGKTDDAKLKKIILEGGEAVGLSVTMPPNPQLKDKPKVVDGLVKKIRGFKK